MENERDPKQPYEILVPDDIRGLYRNYENFVLQTAQGDFLISLNFLLELMQQSRGKLVEYAKEKLW